ncbi:MAG: oxygenase MpaB family protein [Mycobacterium sp.]
MTVSEPIDHVGRPLNDAALPGGRRPPRWMGAADDAAFIGLLSGAANVIMELARPGVGYGVKDSRVESGRADRHPIKRARTTFTYLAVALSGTETQKNAYRRAVNQSHAEVYSKPDSPVEYNAFDKNLQMWVAACLYKGFVDVNRIFVGEMDDDTADRHYREGMTLGTTLQVPAEMWPADRKAFDEYWEESLDQIHIDDAVHEYLWPFAAGRVGNATLPRPLQTRLDAVNLFITTGFLPQRFRDEMRLPWDAAKQRRFNRVMAVIGAVNKVMPRFVRRFPFNWMLRDLDWRMRTGRPLT